MNKFLSGALSLALVLSMSTSVFAANITTNGGSNDTLVTYGMNQGFTVTIPADFDIDATTKKATADVSASDVMIPYGSTLEVTVNGHDYINSWELIDETETTNMLTYTIGSVDGAADIVNGSIVLAVDAGTAHDKTVTSTMHFTVVDELTKAGTYTDTLTFTVGINGNTSIDNPLKFGERYVVVEDYSNGFYYDINFIFNEDGSVEVLFPFNSSLNSQIPAGLLTYNGNTISGLTLIDTNFEKATISADGNTITIYQGNNISAILKLNGMATNRYIIETNPISTLRFESDESSKIKVFLKNEYLDIWNNRILDSCNVKVIPEFSNEIDITNNTENENGFYFEYIGTGNYNITISFDYYDGDNIVRFESASHIQIHVK